VRLAEDPPLVRAAAVQARARAEAEWDARLQARRYLELAAELRSTKPAGQRPEVAPAPARERLTPAVATALHRGAPLRGPLRRLRRLAGLALKASPH
jgi:hypothetical protein